MITIDEEKSLRNEIDTLNENIERKDVIMVGLYNIIVGTANEELVNEAGKIMTEANFGK